MVRRWVIFTAAIMWFGGLFMILYALEIVDRIPKSGDAKLETLVGALIPAGTTAISFAGLLMIFGISQAANSPR